MINLGREHTGRAALPQELDHRGALGMGGGGAESFGREHLADQDRPIGQRKQAEGEDEVSRDGDGRVDEGDCCLLLLVVVTVVVVRGRCC